MKFSPQLPGRARYLTYLSRKDFGPKLCLKYVLDLETRNTAITLISPPGCLDKKSCTLILRSSTCLRGRSFVMKLRPNPTYDVTGTPSKLSLLVRVMLTNQNTIKLCTNISTIHLLWDLLWNFTQLSTFIYSKKDKNSHLGTFWKQEEGREKNSISLKNETGFSFISLSLEFLTF